MKAIPFIQIELLLNSSHAINFFKTKQLVPILAAFLIPIVAFSQPNAEKLEELIIKKVSEQSFEGTILLAEQGEVIFHKSYGFKDYEKKNAINNESKFMIASITKLITSILILQMNEEGKLSLDDNLTNLLPEISIPKSNKITVHHLLLHISGLPNETGLFYQSPKGPKEFVKAVFEESPKVKGFGKFNYANIDYVLLGMIIESIEGKTWYEVVQERILNPAKMNNTGFLERGNYPNTFANTFSYFDGKRVKDPAFFVENFYSAGSMYSTSTDLLKLDQALHTPILLNEVSKEKLYTSYPEYNYTGYGVWTYNYPYVKPSVRIMERRGGIMGGNCTLIRILDLNRTIIILSNNSEFNPDSFGELESLKESLIIEMVSF